MGISPVRSYTIRRRAPGPPPALATARKTYTATLKTAQRHRCSSRGYNGSSYGHRSARRVYRRSGDGYLDRHQQPHRRSRSGPHSHVAIQRQGARRGGDNGSTIIGPKPPRSCTSYGDDDHWSATGSLATLRASSCGEFQPRCYPMAEVELVAGSNSSVLRSGAIRSGDR